MADNNQLELVVEVDVNQANASTRSINTGMSTAEQAAGKAARGASAGIDRLTVSMVKGSAAGTGPLQPGPGDRALPRAPHRWTSDTRRPNPTARPAPGCVPRTPMLSTDAAVPGEIRVLPYELQVGIAIGIGGERLAPVDAALRHVAGDAGEDAPFTPGHIAGSAGDEAGLSGKSRSSG